MDYLQGLPAFALHFSMGLGFVALFLAMFLWLTPHAEIRLIRAGNNTAATALAGALVGYCLPLASALANTAGAVDLAIWASIALAGQFAAYGAIRLLLPGYPARIEAGDSAAATTAASLHIGIGLLNAAAMSY